MRLQGAEEGRFRFRFETTEREWFKRILELYPVQHAPLTPIATDAGANELLEKALQEDRQKLRENAETLLKSGSLEIDAKFNEYWNLTLNAEQIEELLQILNDVRVGLWAQLGRPEVGAEVTFLAPQSEDIVRKHMIMHVCGAWQGALMGAVDGGEADATPG